MLNVMFIDIFGNRESREMLHVPRIGEIVPLFHSRGEVSKVVWFPSMLDDVLTGVDVLITLS